MIGTFAVGGITAAAWGPRLPTITEQVGLTTTVIGFLLTTLAIGAAIGLATAAQISTRLGGRRTLAVALLIVAAAMLCLGGGVFARSIPVIAFAFVLAGLGVSVLDVTANVEGAEVERRADRTWMPLMHAAWSIGIVAGAAIGALCAMIDISPSAQFVGEAVLIAAAVLPVVRAIPLDDRPARQSGSSRPRPRTTWRSVIDRRLLLIGVVMLGVELGEGSANNWLTLAVRDDHQQTASIAALFFAAFATVEATVRIVAGPLVDRIGRVLAVRYTTAIGVVGVILFIVGGPAWVVLLGVALWAVGVSMGFPLGMSAAATGAHAALRVSTVAAIGYVAIFAGPPVIGVLADQHGLLDALWIVVALLGIACAAAGSLASPHSAPETVEVTETENHGEP